MITITRAEAGFALKTLGWALCIIGPLTFSGSQGGRFLQKLGGKESWEFLNFTITDSSVLMGIGMCIIFSSPIVGMFVGIAKRNNDTASTLGGMFVWFCIVVFSMCSSTLAIINNADSTIQAQVHDTPQVKSIKASIEANLKSIESKQGVLDSSIAANAITVKNKQAEIAGRDAVKWQGMRNDLSDDINSLNYQNDYQTTKTTAEIAELIAANEALTDKLTEAEEKGTGSTVASSVNALEGFGITVVKIALLAAFLLDLLPFYASTQVGSSIRMVRQQVEENHESVEIDADVMERSTVKKYQRPNLKAVA